MNLLKKCEELLPEEGELTIPAVLTDDQNFNFKVLGYNQALYDVRQILPDILQVIKKEIQNIEIIPYATTDEFKDYVLDLFDERNI